MLGRADRFLGATLGPPDADERRAGRGGLFSGSWRRSSAVEAVGAAVLLVVVVLARPGAGEAAAVLDGGSDAFESVAAGVGPDGAVVLGSGARVHLLGVTLPTAEDPPVVRAAAFEMLDRLVRGRRVWVAFDPVLPSALQAGQPATVAYVWVLDGAGRRQAMAGSVLLARGLARPVTTLGYAEQGRFVRAARLARDRGAGLWRPTPTDVAAGPAGVPPVLLPTP